MISSEMLFPLNLWMEGVLNADCRSACLFLLPCFAALLCCLALLPCPPTSVGLTAICRYFSVWDDHLCSRWDASWVKTYLCLARVLCVHQGQQDYHRECDKLWKDIGNTRTRRRRSHRKTKREVWGKNSCATTKDTTGCSAIAHCCVSLVFFSSHHYFQYLD